MAEEKTDLSTAGGDGSREAGTGIGLAFADNVKAGEAGFLDAAADQLAALDAEDGGEQPKKKRKAKPAEEDTDAESLDEQEGEEDAGEDEGEEETPEEDDQGEETGVDEDGEGEEDAKVSLRLNGKKASLEDILDHVGATVTVNGEEIEVTGDELIKGYQRGKDYSDKTTELKRERDDLMPYTQMVAHAKTDPQFMEYVQSYFQNGPYPEVANNPLLRTSDADLAKLMNPDDPAYDQTKAAEVVKLRSEWQAKSADRQQINQRAQQDMQARWNAWAGEQINTAKAHIDQIGVDQGFNGKDGEYVAKSQQVLEFLKASGYNEDEISSQAMMDARSAVLAYKASEYDRMMKESDSPRVTLGKKRKRPAPPRSQKAGSGTRRTSGKRQQRDSFRKASKEQTTDSWVSALEKRLG